MDGSRLLLLLWGTESLPLDFEFLVRKSDFCFSCSEETTEFLHGDTTDCGESMAAQQILKPVKEQKKNLMQLFLRKKQDFPENQTSFKDLRTKA